MTTGISRYNFPLFLACYATFASILEERRRPGCRQSCPRRNAMRFAWAVARHFSSTLTEGVLNIDSHPLLQSDLQIVLEANVVCFGAPETS